MSDFHIATPIQRALDPFKRVKYSLGLVLGVDEFDQEQTYLLARDNLHQRALHGYGTVCGLRVSLRPDSPTPEILVSPGLAVNPQGQTIRVPAAQCARLDDWLASHAEAVGENRDGDALTLYVTLCYRECETDKVPVPGGPCRTEEESMVASRIADDFALQLRFARERPLQVEEEMVRRFGSWLRRLTITPEALTFADLDDLLDAVRGLPDAEEPLDDAPLYLHPDDASDTLQAIFHVWVTEVRAVLLPDDLNCGGGPPGESCVILARLDFGLTAAGLLDGDVTINDAERPILLHTRLLQEWLMSGAIQTAGRLSRHFATLSAPDETTLRAWVHHPALLTIPLAAVEVTVNETAVSPTAITQTPNLNLFDLTGLTLVDGDRVAVRFDAAQISETESGNLLAALLDAAHFAYTDRQDNALSAYFVVVGIPTLDGLADVNAPAPADGDVLAWNEAAGHWQNQPHTHDHTHLLADLGDVAATPPNPSQVLTWDGATWRPQDPAGSPATGHFVHAPVGYYEIIAAGFFNEEGGRLAESYNGLRATFLGDGQYLLRFPDYDPDDGLTYIVKGTIFDRSLPELVDTDPFDPRNPATAPAVFQVVEFSREGIVVWITQALLLDEVIMAIAQGQTRGFDNVLRFRPISRPFMVEISRYSMEERPLRERVNLNTATEEELRSLPRIGPALAGRIVAERETSGSFTTLDDLTRVSGIGPALLDDIRPFITVRR